MPDDLRSRHVNSASGIAVRRQLDARVDVADFYVGYLDQVLHNGVNGDAVNTTFVYPVQKLALIAGAVQVETRRKLSQLAGFFFTQQRHVYRRYMAFNFVGF